ncbi:MAG: NAD-dependent deacylase [Muribaculaceae bacterium]|nr:NAD-dependent deacylase [Bacteroides sp.]MDE6428214.1 NAD-dependent deacylase [Muribaculaceae bacterium]
MKNLVFLTGAGISAESGISTFRDADGLWEQYDVMDVCSADGFRRNPKLVHEFYNARRRQLADVKPNRAHEIIRELMDDFNVCVITQNVDNLHERAGVPEDLIIHLHGELMKVRALDDEFKVYELRPEACETSPETIIDGHHVRPHIVFFQEAVPMLEPAAEIVSQADILVIVGTSMVVYPAAGLINYARPGAKIYYVDPNPAPVPPSVHVIAKPATVGLQIVADEIRRDL